MPAVAIVGSGLAGLAAAQRLRDLRSEAAVTLWERELEVGGRAASRTVRGATFDPGAQYAKAPTPELEMLLTQTLGHETLVDIGLPVWTFDGRGAIHAGDPALDAGAKWTYTDGLSRLARELASGLDVRAGMQVDRLQREGSRWRVNARSISPSALTLPSPTAVGEGFDAVLLTPPAPVSGAILAASGLPDAEELAAIPYRPCVTWTFGYRAELAARPWYAMVNADKRHPISWLAYEHRKPQRPMGGLQVILAQMAPDWSRDHLGDQDPRPVLDMLAALLGEPAIASPAWTDWLPWRHALPDGRADGAKLEAALPGVFFAGDFTAGQGRIHLAIEEGWRAADRISQALPR